MILKNSVLCNRVTSWLYRFHSNPQEQFLSSSSKKAPNFSIDASRPYDIKMKYNILNLLAPVSGTEHHCGLGVAPWKHLSHLKAGPWILLSGNSPSFDPVPDDISLWIHFLAKMLFNPLGWKVHCPSCARLPFNSCPSSKSNSKLESKGLLYINNF